MFLARQKAPQGSAVTSGDLKKKMYILFFSFSHSKCLLTALFRNMIPNVNCIVQTRICLCEGCPVVGAYLNMVVVSLVCKLCLGFLYFQP